MNSISPSILAPVPGVSANTDLAMLFLTKHYRGKGPVNLVAIHPVTGRLSGRTFEEFDKAEIRAWIDERQGRENLYYSVNRPRPGINKSKLADSDIGELLAVVVDLDPRAAEEIKAGGFDRERTRIMQQVCALSDGMAPCFVQDSGGGFQLSYWFENPIAYEKDSEAARLYATVGRKISAHLDGDAVHEPSRIMRLVGTINLPDSKKASRGRQPRAAAVFRYGNNEEVRKSRLKRRWSLEELDAAFPALPERSTTVSRTSNIATMPSLDWQDILDGPSDELAVGFAQACVDYPKLKLRWEGSADGLEVDQSRSAFDMSLAGLLKSYGGFEFEDYCRLSIDWEHGRGIEGAASYYWRTWCKSNAEPRQSASRDFAFGQEEDLDRRKLKDLVADDIHDPEKASYLCWLRKERPALFEEWLVPVALIDVSAEEIHLALDRATSHPAGIDVEALRQVITSRGQPALFETDTAKKIARLKLTAPAAFHTLREASGAVRAFDQAATRGEALLAEEVHTSAHLAAGKTPVYFSENRLSELAAETDQILAKAPSPLSVYRFAKAYCVIAQEEGAEGTNRPLFIRRLKGELLRDHVMQVCEFYSPRRGGAWVPSKCPDLLLNNLLAREGGSAKPLDGVITCPTLREDGSLISSAGYDAATKLYADFDPSRFPISSTGLTKEDAEGAYRYLSGTVFDEFPFATETDKAATVAALVTAILRRTRLSTAPGFAFRAPVQSTGKTTLARFIGTLAFGSTPPVSAWPGEEAELRKMILAMLLKARPMILFDNVPLGERIEGGPGLREMLTSETYEGRILGVSETVSVSTRCLIVLTGNNITFSGDAASRIIPIQLDTKEERPDLRSFKRPNLEEWAMKHRGEAVTAALKICIAYLQAGEPQVAIPGSRYPEFRRAVAAPLMWAGAPNVLAPVNKSIESDPTRGLEGNLLRNLRERFGDQSFLAREIIEETASVNDAAENPLGKAMWIIRELSHSSKGNNTLGAAAVGTLLKKLEGKVLENLRLESLMNPRTKIAEWTVNAV